MNIDEIRELVKTATENLDLKDFKGDVVAFKYVESQFGNVEAGGIGVQNNYGCGADRAQPAGQDGGCGGDVPSVGAIPEADEELFHFIHPGVTEAEEVSLHQTVKRLVRQCGVQEICRFLSELAEQNKLLLPMGVKIAYYELERMGMPTSKEGFNYKTFAKYYRK